MREIITIIIVTFVSLLITTSGCLDSKNDNEKEEIEQKKDEEFKLEGWSKEIKITDGIGDSREPSLAIDSKTNIHIIYREVNEDLDLCNIRYTKLNSGNIIVNNKILASNLGWAGAIWWPQIAIDSKDNVHCCWPIPSKYDDTEAESQYMKLDNDGNILVYHTNPPSSDILSLGDILIDSGDNINLIGGGTTLCYMKLDNNGNVIIDKKRFLYWPPGIGAGDKKIDSKDYIHITWAHITNISRDYTDLYYNKLDNNGNVLINHSRLTFSQTAMSGSKVAIDSKNNVHIVWADLRDWDPTLKHYEREIYYKKIDNNGNILINDTRLTHGNNEGPAIAIDSKDNIYIAWCNATSYIDKSYLIIYYKVLDNNGNILINDTRISTSKWVGDAKIVIDSNDKIHIIFQGHIWDDGDGIIYKTNAFSENITSDSIDNSEKSDDFPISFELGLFTIIIIIAIVGVIVWWRRRKRSKSK